MAYDNFRLARRIDANTIALYTDDLTKLLTLDKTTADYITIKGGLATTKNLAIKANQTDTYPFLKLLGDDIIGFELGTAKSFCFYENGTLFLKINEQGNVTLESQGDRDIELYTGAGKVKFGTHSASGDVACNGSISIKDAGGTARKLMTTA